MPGTFYFNRYICYLLGLVLSLFISFNYKWKEVKCMNWMSEKKKGRMKKGNGWSVKHAFFIRAFFTTFSSFPSSFSLITMDWAEVKEAWIKLNEERKERGVVVEWKKKNGTNHASLYYHCVRSFFFIHSSPLLFVPLFG